MRRNWLLILLMGVFSSIFFANNAFASTQTLVNINDLEITIDRELGEIEEIYTVNSNDALEDFSLELSEDNNFTVTNLGDDSWSVSATYKGTSYSASGSNSIISIDDKSININVVSAQEIRFTIDKELSDAFFNKILDNHEPFTLEATSVAGKIINVQRTTISGGNDTYIFSSNVSLSSVEVVDGTDNITITKTGDIYNVAGQYKGITGSASVSVGGHTIITYNDISVGVIVSSDMQTITLDADPAIVQEIAQRILDEKRNVTEATITQGTPYEIPSNSNLSTIDIPASVSNPEVKFTLVDNTAQINKELTVNSVNTGTTVVFPEGTLITGPVGWDGVVELPVISSASLQISGYNTNVETVIEIGLSSGSLSFDKPVEILFPNKAGKKVGFMIGGVFTEITTVCSGGTIPGGANECKVDSGNDLLVLTKHFTQFITYTQTATGGGGGGGGGGSSSVPAPSFSNVRVVAGSDKAVITWDTNRSSLSWIVYGTSISYGQESKNTIYAASHNVTLSGLLPVTIYHYQIKSSDVNGSVGTYTDGTFTTLALGQGVIGDSNSDGKVDKYDFSLMMSNWGKTGVNVCDLNNDLKVDKYDFSLMMSNWNK